MMLTCIVSSTYSAAAEFSRVGLVEALCLVYLSQPMSACCCCVAARGLHEHVILDLWNACNVHHAQIICVVFGLPLCSTSGIRPHTRLVSGDSLCTECSSSAVCSALYAAALVAAYVLQAAVDRRTGPLTTAARSCWGLLQSGPCVDAESSSFLVTCCEFVACCSFCCLTKCAAAAAAAQLLTAGHTFGLQQ
jgi:hypothetical protein